MPRLRLLIDDAPACLTQRAVLAEFAALLSAREGGFGGPGDVTGRDVEVTWSSALRDLPSWPEVPAECSRRLAVRVAALAPLPDTVTVFLPAHAIVQPFNIAQAMAGRPAHTLASNGIAAVADLDLFVVDNASAEVAAYRAHLQAHPDYESASRYEAFVAGALPAWLVEGGLSSACLFTRRPWYSAHAPDRGAWLSVVARALDTGRLTLAMVADDVRHGRVRPSLLEEVQSLRGEPLPAGGADLTLDALFVPPERRLPPAQRALLHSRELHNRTLAYARRNSARKGGRKGGLRGGVRAVLRPLRQTWRLGWRVLHAIYAASLRPLVHRLRALGGVGS